MELGDAAAASCSDSIPGTKCGCFLSSGQRDPPLGKNKRHPIIVYRFIDLIGFICIGILLLELAAATAAIASLPPPAFYFDISSFVNCRNTIPSLSTRTRHNSAIVGTTLFLSFLFCLAFLPSFFVALLPGKQAIIFLPLLPGIQLFVCLPRLACAEESCLFTHARRLPPPPWTPPPSTTTSNVCSSDITTI